MQGKWILAAWIAASASCSGWAVTSHYPITAAQVSAAISLAGEQVPPEQVQLLSAVVATSSAPELHVQSVDRTSSGQLMVRMECNTSEQCLPFVVTVRSSSEAVARLAARYAPAGEAGRINTMPSQGAQVMRNGEHAVLHLDGKHIHIAIPVITLENGAVGQRIRVTEKDSRLTYMAVVVDRGLLQGRL